MTLLTTAVILLWMVVLGLTLLVLILYRQFGLLYLGSGGRVRLTGLTIGRKAPAGQAVLLDGEPLLLDWTSPGPGRASLLIFGGPRCPICEQLLPQLDEAVSLWGSLVDVLFLDRHSTASSDSATRELPYDRRWHYALSEDSSVYRDFDVEVSPYAFLVDDTGRVLNKRIVNSLDHLALVVEDAVDEATGRLRPVLEQPVRLIDTPRVRGFAAAETQHTGAP